MSLMKPVQINGRWYLEPTTEAKLVYHQQMLREGLTLIEEPHPLGKIQRYVRADLYESSIKIIEDDK
jgi:hypothetical protein